MSELLISIILAVCPIPDEAKTTECQEKIVNCAIQEGGKLDEATIKECLDNKTKDRK